jgi:hypothetical protein
MTTNENNIPWCSRKINIKATLKLLKNLEKAITANITPDTKDYVYVYITKAVWEDLEPKYKKFIEAISEKI